MFFPPAAALPALADLQLTPLERQEVQVAWRAHQEGLKGYWLSWERENSHSSSSKPSVASAYLPPTSRSTRLVHLAPSSRVCVTPVYSSGRGDGLCCTAERHTGWLSGLLLSAIFPLNSCNYVYTKHICFIRGSVILPISLSLLSDRFQPVGLTTGVCSNHAAGGKKKR